VYRQEFSGTAERLININLAGKASGSYLVRLGYEDPKDDISQWVIKY
jgi:hypothetical protein